MFSGERWDEDMARAPAGPTKAKFISSGLAESFIPWGVGERICPGRGNARRTIIAVVAIMVERFDMEIFSEEFELNPAFWTWNPTTAATYPIQDTKTKDRARKSNSNARSGKQGAWKSPPYELSFGHCKKYA